MSRTTSGRPCSRLQPSLLCLLSLLVVTFSTQNTFASFSIPPRASRRSLDRSGPSGTTRFTFVIVFQPVSLVVRPNGCRFGRAFSVSSRRGHKITVYGYAETIRRSVTTDSLRQRTTRRYERACFLRNGTIIIIMFKKK